MRTKIIEATNGMNWGKFLLGVFSDDDASYRSKVDSTKLLQGRGIYDHHEIVMVTDLQTKEGALFYPRREGDFDTVKHDLGKHRIWVCPMYEFFLRWLYEQPIEKIYALDLPELVNIDTKFFAFAGYRRPGPDAAVAEFIAAAEKDDCPVCGSPGNSDVEERPAAFRALVAAMKT